VADIKDSINVVKVCDMSGAANCYFRGLQTIANDVRKAEIIMSPGNAILSLLTATTPVTPEYKTWGFGWAHC